jgi:hypothetical protein
LNTIASPAALLPGPLVTLVLALTGEKALSMGLVVRRCSLAAVSPHADDDQAAQPALLTQANAEVHAIGPAGHVVHLGQVPLGEGFAFGLPLLAQPGDHRGRQPRRRPEQLLQRRHEVLTGQPVQVQQRQHRGDLRAAPDPPGQDHALELLALPGRRVHPPVVHPGAHDLDLARPGGDLAGWGVAVAAHQPMPVLVGQRGEAAM